MSAAPDSSAAVRTRRIATLALGSVCLFWGATFLLMKLGTSRLTAIFGEGNETTSGAWFLLVRFALAAVLTPVVFPGGLRKLDRRTWQLGFWLSLIFCLGFFLQIFGLAQADIHPGQSAFLTSLYVVATPIFAALLQRRLPARGVLLGVPLAMLGAGFISGPPEGGLSLGAWLTVGCAVAFGGHIVATDYATKRTDPFALTFVMLVFSSIWALIVLLLTPGGATALEPHMLAATLSDSTFLITVGLCAVLATVIALSVLNRWQKEVSPSRAAVIYTGEPVAAALISIAAGQEEFTGWLVFGSVMILLANLAAEFVGRRAPARQNT